MLQFTFVTALTLVSALALALVYGLGGWLALGGQLAAGDVVVLALLLTRLYAPLTALSNARVEIMSALVSFERVFEILDLKPLIQQKPDAVASPPGPLSVEFDDVRFAYPVGGQGLAGLAGGRRHPGYPRRRRGAARHQLPGGARPDRGPGGLLGRRQVHHRPAAVPPVRRRFRRRPLRRHGPGTGVDVRDLTFDSMRQTLGMVTQDGHLFHECIALQPAAGPPGRHRRADVGRAAPRPARRPWSGPCRTAWTPWWGSAATGSPAANASG